MKRTFANQAIPEKGAPIRETFENEEGTVTNYYSFYSYSYRPDYIDVLTDEGSRISLLRKNCHVEIDNNYWGIKKKESGDHK